MRDVPCKVFVKSLVEKALIFSESFSKKCSLKWFLFDNLSYLCTLYLGIALMNKQAQFSTT